MKTIYHKVLNRGSPLIQLVKRSQAILLTISSLFPFGLFKNKIIVDENKVSLVHTEIFGIEHVHSILVEDITEVTVQTGFFFASLKLTESTNPRFPTTYTINYLRKKDALLARRIIQGLIEAKREGVQIDTTDNQSLAKDIEQLGLAMGE